MENFKAINIIIISLCVLALSTAGSFAANGDKHVDQSGTRGVWISHNEIRRLPAQGPSWENVLKYANQPLLRPNIKDQDNPENIVVFAKSLIYARTGNSVMKAEVEKACMSLIGTEDGATTLSVGKRLLAYIVAAELIGLTEGEALRFQRWLKNLALTRLQDGRSIVETHERRPNNWGTLAGAARIAIAIYTGDLKEVQKASTVFRGWLGDRSAYDGFKFGEMDWQYDPRKPVGVNPAGATKNGYNIDGVLPDDQRRSGPFRWPPPKENYVYTALQGAVAQAVMLNRSGFDVWDWSDKALLRAFRWLYNEAQYMATGDDEWMVHVINHFYGTNLPGKIPTKPGKIIGFTDWTHTRNTSP